MSTSISRTVHASYPRCCLTSSIPSLLYRSGLSKIIRRGHRGRGRGGGVMQTNAACTSPASTIRRSIVGLMLGQRLRRWPNIKTTMGHRLLFEGMMTTFQHCRWSQQSADISDGVGRRGTVLLTCTSDSINPRGPLFAWRNPLNEHSISSPVTAGMPGILS